jgi:hypothetical protein
MPKIPCDHYGYKGLCGANSLTGTCGKHKKRGLKKPVKCAKCDNITQSKSGHCSHCSNGQMDFYQKKKLRYTMTENQRLKFMTEMFNACASLDLSIQCMQH